MERKSFLDRYGLLIVACYFVQNFFIYSRSFHIADISAFLFAIGFFLLFLWDRNEQNKNADKKSIQK